MLKTKNYDDIKGQYAGLIKFRKDSLRKIHNIYQNLEGNISNSFKNLYMTDFIQILIKRKIEVKASLVNGGWLEVDTESDLINYISLDKSGELDAFYNK